jgi:hypothetical protein
MSSAAGGKTEIVHKRSGCPPADSRQVGVFIRCTHFDPACRNRLRTIQYSATQYSANRLRQRAAEVRMLVTVSGQADRRILDCHESRNRSLQFEPPPSMKLE